MVASTAASVASHVRASQARVAAWTQTRVALACAACLASVLASIRKGNGSHALDTLSGGGGSALLGLLVSKDGSGSGGYSKGDGRFVGYEGKENLRN